MNLARKIKNIIVGNRNVLGFFIFLFNLPILGRLYDLIYFKISRSRIESMNVELTIEPSNICNLKCIMCPYQRTKRKKVIMSMALFKKIVDQAKDLGIETIYLQQYNEPFLDKNIFERINYIRSKGMKTLIYSNGTVLNQEMREKILNSPPNTIRFSVDGAKKETFERIRKGAKFEVVINNIINLFKERNKLKQELPKIEVYFTLLEENKNEAKSFLDFWKNKCDFATLYPADSRESGKFPPVSWRGKKPYPCFNPKNPIVLSNGRVALCCVDIDGDVELGNLNNQSLKEVLNSKKIKEIYESQMKRKCKIPMCKNCSKLYIDSAFMWWVK